MLVRSHAPSYGGLFARSAVLGRLVTSMHVATAPDVIRHFVLLKKGEPCSALLRRETERILRAQPFLADAVVTAYVDGDGVRVEIVTVDEPSIVASLGVTGSSPYVRAATFGNQNVQGKGIAAIAGWRTSDFYRDTFLGSYTNYQLFQRPYQLHARFARRDHGYDVASSIAFPFFTDLQPRAWRVSGGASNELVPFRSPGRPRISLGLRRQYFDAGGGLRLGTIGHLFLVGASVSAERATPEAEPVLVTDSGVVTDTTAALIDRFRPQRVTRLNLLFGYRSVNFLRVVGFDALNGAQDMRRGIQIGTTIGRGLSIAGSDPDELYSAIDLYTGVGSTHTFAGLEVVTEGHWNSRATSWHGILTSGRFGLYLRPHPKHTITSSLEVASGWRQRLPFQFSLGDARGGVRGYADAELGGAHRVVLRTEERWRVGTIHGTGDAGVAIFGDIGRLWAGAAALGRDTPWHPALGVGLLGAVPPGSQRMWRADFAFPLRHAPGASWEFRITSADRTRAFWIEPNDVRLSRERSVPASVFRWP